MTHLDDIQLLDALEGEPAAATHAAACEACAARVSELRATLLAVRQVDVPEPSPLFWTHFAARVNAALDAASPRRTAWFGVPRLAWMAGTAAAAAFAVALGITSLERGAQPPPPDPVLAHVQGAAGELPTDDDIEADQAWAVMRSIAEDLDYETVREAGVLPPAGAVERAALELSERERAELARLIEEEMKRTDS